MDVLVTGGAGYIGSTIVSALRDSGHRPVVLDDLSTGCPGFLDGHVCYVGDIADRALVHRIMRENPGIAMVVHCAGRVVAPESVREPVAYYRTNVVGTLALVESLVDAGVRNLVFSSSAAIYGGGADLAVDEASRWDPRSPYATTKAVVERMLGDIAATGALRVLSLRYFNPVGADPLLRSGPRPGPAGQVVGRLIEARRSATPFTVTGVDYPTADGTAIRDYVHVWDLARAHVAAVERFDRALQGRPCATINLGSGRGTTVRELVAVFEQVTGQRLRVVDLPRRPGDTVGAFARTAKAACLLDWRAELPLASALADALAWAHHSGRSRALVPSGASRTEPEEVR